MRRRGSAKKRSPPGMMVPFFKRKKENHTTSPKKSSNESMDVLATVLRDTGEISSPSCQDPAGFRESCERWALHVLNGAAVEGVHEEIPRNRDWIGVRRFYRESREEEVQQDIAQRETFKDLVWDMVSTMSSITGSSQNHSDDIRKSMGKLVVAMKSDSVETLRTAVSSTIDSVVNALEEQRKHFDQEIQTLGERLADMRDDLLEAKRQMDIDALTEVFNRGAFDESMARYFEFSKLSGSSFTLMMLDLDHFKRVNDRYGHPTGDKVLRATADALVRTFPRRNDFIARYGGEEFAIILLDTRPEDHSKLAERLLQNVREMGLTHQSYKIWITCSVGIATRKANDTIESLIQRADRALYQAKDNGRDTFVLSED